MGFDNALVRLDVDSMPQPDLEMLIDPALVGSARIDADDYGSGSPEMVLAVAASTDTDDLNQKFDGTSTQIGACVAATVFLVPISLLEAYSPVVTILNTVTIELRGTSLSVLKLPLPWPGTVHLDATKVARLNTRPQPNNPGRVAIDAELSDGRLQRWVAGLREADQLPFIHQQLDPPLARIQGTPPASARPVHDPAGGQ